MDAGHEKVEFHLNGDIGGSATGHRGSWSEEMEADLNKPSSDGETPAFLYLTGDCLYDNGQVADYNAKY